MLILTRRIGERLVIDGDTFVRILGVKGNQVRIGIEAPQQVTVHREEIQNKIDSEKKEASVCDIKYKKNPKYNKPAVHKSFWTCDEELPESIAHS